MLQVNSNGNPSTRSHYTRDSDKPPVIPFEELCRRYNYIRDPNKLESEAKWHFNRFVFNNHLLGAPDIMHIMEDVLIKQGNKCDDCGAPQSTEDRPQFRTKIPVCEGGVGVENLKLICLACKGTKSSYRPAARRVVEYTSKGVRVIPLKNGCGYEGMKRMITNHPTMPQEVKAAKLKEIEETGTLSSNPSKTRLSSTRSGFNSIKKMPMFKEAIKPRLYFEQSGCCAMCEKHIPKEKVTIDHIVPLDKGGLNEESNMQVLCHTCNVQKNNMEVKQKVFNPDGTVTITLGH